MAEVPKRGRPSKFNGSLSAKMLELAKQGKTNEQIAEDIGISARTLLNWKGRHPDLLRALSRGKRVADELVEVSLFARAVGYTHTEEKVFCYEGNIVTHQTLKHYPPDVGAQTLWLKNRMPDQWREKQPGEDDKTINHTGEIKVVKIDLDERAAQLRAEIDK